ncbi:hypothetical protein BU23DRAFT_572549 [Bimuria novae-zelandiae CBS 107.79]|uniref:Uncharacterized protein n=1 Tax=Bimuria novae-zelandiae CBS 107.79 TaxID=1447943 RepID=A0A6A5UTM5_9PLEO|nr:hypothetical protein BU23DRAFT_572549 [Bimuria novae-zelandiae CBS 107.79]
MVPTTQGSNKLRIIATSNFAEFIATNTPVPALPAQNTRSKTLAPLTPPERGSLRDLHTPPPPKEHHTEPPIEDDDRARAAEHLRLQREALYNHIIDTRSYYHADGELRTDWMYRVAAIDTDDYGNLLGEGESELLPRVNADWLSPEEMAWKREGFGASGLRNEVRVEGRRAVGARGKGELGRRKVGGMWDHLEG